MQQLAQALEPRRRLNLAQHRPPQDLQRLLVLQTRPFRREALQRNHRHRLRDRRVQCLHRLRQVHQPHHLPRALLRLLRQPALLCLQAHRQRSYLRLPQRPPRQTGAVVVIMTPTTTEDQATVTETYDFRKPSVDDCAQRAQPAALSGCEVMPAAAGTARRVVRWRRAPIGGRNPMRSRSQPRIPVVDQLRVRPASTRSTSTARSPFDTGAGYTTSGSARLTEIGGSRCSSTGATSKSWLFTAHPSDALYSTAPATANRKLDHAISGLRCLDTSVCSMSRDVTTAEGVGFEPTETLVSRLFKSRAFVRSAIPPSARQGSRHPRYAGGVTDPRST
jgi:hypothetical protein